MTDEVDYGSKSLNELGNASKAYQELASTFAQDMADYSEAKADLKRERAKYKLQLKANRKAQGETVSVAMLEVEADADEELFKAEMRLITAESRFEGLKKQLQAIQNKIDVGRSFVAVQREQDKLETKAGV